MMASPPKSKALLLLFPGFNTLDVNGPLEAFTKSGSSGLFEVTIASETEHTTSVEGAIMKRHKVLDSALIESLHKFDLLIVPGGFASGPESAVQKQASDTSGPFMTLIHEFAQLSPRTAHFPRVLLSICTGAIFLGNLGIFDGRYCTTHWSSYATLNDYNIRSAASTGGKPGTVLPARFVDSGVNGAEVRIISSGGISCGIDASLHVITLRAGEDEALATAKLLDYAWRKTDGVVFGESFSG